MYSGSSKLGRGGAGRGAGGPRNRASFPPPPPHRPSSSTGRLSMGSGPRNRATAAGAAPATAVEESFSLVSGNNPLAFSMIIRLTPDLVDEIRRLEAQGRTARIKFDSIPNNPSGNVIDVGGKEFKFTWSPDSGELCDIYEERKNEDGNDMLVESGCAWRKLNVQRILDESTTNHVKKRSEEAERKHKSRKAIVLDHANPPSKTQIKQLAAAEASPWKSHFKKEPPPKKRKVEPTQVAVGGPIKSTYKSGSAPNVSAKHSVSPCPPPPERPGASVSPSGTGKVTKSNAVIEDTIPTQLKVKENVTKSEKEIPIRASGVIQEAPGRKGNSEAKPMDLQSMLITLLKDKPMGMSIKSLEKATGDTFPDCAKKIEPILKKIAIYQAPGKYLLKEGVDLEDLKKCASESGSSPEDNHHQRLALHDNHDQLPAPAPSFVDKASLGELEEEGQLNSKLEESSALEQIDIQHHSPDTGGERKASDNSEGHAGSASDSESDSDSDSDSSDSGSESGSHSKSRSRSGSLAGSGSGSSSDSESDASSNSKEGSDEDVNIMTSDDEKDPRHQLPTSEAGVSVSPMPWQTNKVRPLQNDADENEDDGFDSVDIEGHGSEPVDIEGHGSEPIDIEGHGSDAVDIEKDLLDDEQEIGMASNATLHEEGEKPVEGSKRSSSYHNKFQERQNFIGNLSEDNFRQEQADSSERIVRGKSKRSSDAKQFDEKSERAKKLKAESLAQPPISGRQDDNFFGSHDFSPNRSIDEREANANLGSQKVSNQVYPAKSSSDFQQSSRRLSDQGTRTKASDTVERPNKHTENSSYGRKLSENNVLEGYPILKDKASRDSQHEESYMKDKKIARNTKEGGAGGKHSVPSDFYHRKHGEVVGKFKEGTQFSGSFMESSPKDNNRAAADRHPANGRSNMLRRELSDLELGELREPLPEETPVKQFDRKGSFKLSEGKPSMSENCNLDLHKGKPVGKITWDSGKQSPPNSSVGIKRTPEHHVEGSIRSHQRGAQSQPQHLSRVDHAELGPQFNRSADSSSKSRQNETGARIGVGIEGYGESHKKAPTGAPQQQESKQGSMSHSLKDKTRASSMADLTDGQRDLEDNFSGRKKSGSSDEDNSYSKYEKDDPEYKGPINDLSQYKEYVQEYQDKYDCYCSLNKILERYRNEFQKLGKDLESFKGRDTEKYNKTLTQLRESYRQCGLRHKRLKKIFVVLHEELKNVKQRIKDYALSYTKE